MGYRCRPANGERYARAKRRRRQKLDAEAACKQASLGNVCSQTIVSASELSSQAYSLAGHESQTDQSSGAANVLPSHTGHASSGAALISQGTTNVQAVLTSVTSNNIMTSQGGAGLTGQTGATNALTCQSTTNVLNIQTGQTSVVTNAPTIQTSQARATNVPNIQTSEANNIQSGQACEGTGQTNRAASQPDEASLTVGQAIGLTAQTSTTSIVTNELTNQTGLAIMEALLNNKASELTIIRNSDLEELHSAKSQLSKEVSLLKQMIDRLQLNEQLLKDNKQFLAYYTGEIICSCMFISTGFCRFCVLRSFESIFRFCISIFTCQNQAV